MSSWVQDYSRSLCMACLHHVFSAVARAAVHSGFRIGAIHTRIMSLISEKMITE